MPNTLSKGVPYFEHPLVERPTDLNWEAVRVFLCLKRAGSFRTAAGTLGIATNTVRRYIEVLERDIGSPLVLRGVGGIELTSEGMQLYDAAIRMEDAAYDVRRIARKGFSQLAGSVRISVTEGIGTFWVMPRLVEFQRAHPKLIIELNCTMRPADVSRMEADIGIQLVRPETPDVKAVKLGRLHAMPFAAPEYLQTFGRPTSIEEVKQHRIIDQPAAQLDAAAVDRLFPDTPREGFLAIVTNTSTAHYWAVAKGAGIGMLPTYLWAIGARVEPVEIGLHTQYDIWMVYHPDSRKIGRIGATIDWLKTLFDPKTFPWFRDEFIPPERLTGASKDTARPNLFDGFAGR